MLLVEGQESRMGILCLNTWFRSYRIDLSKSPSLYLGSSDHFDMNGMSSSEATHI
jgi:hypothetical protein